MIKHEPGAQKPSDDADSSEQDVPTPPDDPANDKAPVKEPPSKEAPKHV